MADKPKDRSATPPHGAFTSKNVVAPAAPAAKPAAKEPKPGRPRIPGLSFPPATPLPQLGADEVVLDDIEANTTARAGGSLPPPLGQSEEHDAWTTDRLSRQSTVPPVRHADVDRLRKLSATEMEVPLKDTEGGALDLVDRSRPSQQLDLVGEMEELYALDDLTGALRHAELILGRMPDHEQAQRCAANCRSRLIQLYTSKVGATDRVVSVALSESQLRWLGLDHRSGFLLSRVDGVSSVEELLDVCGMPRLEALKTLADLLERGAIRLGRR
ncbi:MAG TPA: hypothetical protein VF331_26710 [Polyangiales bacterium]